MEIKLTNKTAIITGGSMGLGRAMAQSFYQAGAKVAILARREGPLQETRAAIVGLGSGAGADGGAPPTGAQIEAYSCDVSDAAAVTKVHAQVVADLGDVDILVNNAGQSATKPFMSITDAEWQADMDLKLFAAIRLSRAVWPAMERNGGGRIINLLNTAAKAPPPNSAPTSVTRAAGMAFTKVLAGEGAPHNILVNALLIGFMKSDQIRRMFDASGANQTLDEFIDAAGARLPMGRMGEAEECANLALFLASDAASYVTGTAINMDGGLSKVV